jgi:hypothetical protein
VVQRIRATYGANFERLVEVKKRYDPDHFFRVNRNIRVRGAQRTDARLSSTQ